MPQLLTFDHGVRSRGDGFIKTPSSGMWQCTLLLDRILQEEKENNNTIYRADEKIIQNMDRQQLLMLQNPKKSATILPGHFHPFPRQFQLISTSSRYLCSILVAERSHTANDIQIISLQKISAKIKLSEGVGVVFASAAEGSWADILSFMHQSPMCLIDEVSRVAVWKLEWESPYENGIDLSSVFFWRVTSSLPIFEKVECAFGKEEMVYIAVGKARGALHTPPDRKLLKPMDPPPLLPKPPREESLRDTLGQRNLSTEFIEAQGSHVDVREKESEEVSRVTATVTAVEVAQLQESKVRPPTYAEILMKNARVQRREKKIPNDPLYDWCQRLFKLRDEFPCDICSDAALQFAKGHVSQQHQQQRQKQQPQQLQKRDTGNGGSIDTLMMATLKEFLCDVLLEISWCQVLKQRDGRDITVLLQECTETAEVVGKELQNWSSSSIMLQFPCRIQQLRLVRHRCFALVLLGQPVGPALLQEALRLSKRLLGLLRDLPQEERDFSVRADHTSTGQVVCGVLSAALALMEVSLLVQRSGALRDDMTCIAGLLLLWLRDATTNSTNVFTLPAALLARVSEAAAAKSGGRLNGLLRRCEDVGCLNGLQSNSESGSGTAGLCCGIVRPAWCSAVFDQRFARALALVRRCESPITTTITVAAKRKERNYKKE
ncbi:uncharacterized protein TM35_000292440 [Trypanosoma theileri]|uniref:Uncharacterized protein n=1 Tax=Trypanosoma theileri TaxID=67003 RepID=A0A1X0NNR3_9TRYP|nr:uncharacterized protein TM35_000292440 [Trypanosoma theileri]ORC86362.1 hypothetical protein TM35_000292440 [Trypanosoma theileri]